MSESELAIWAQHFVPGPIILDLNVSLEKELNLPSAYPVMRSSHTPSVRSEL